MAAESAQMDAFEVMRRGCPMTKNGNTWSHFDFRMFQLTQDQDAIIWTKKSVMQEERIPIRSILRIDEGQQSETFQKDAKKGIEHLSFSITFRNEAGEEEVFDLICCRQSDCVAWVRGLRSLTTDGFNTACLVDIPDNKVDVSLAAILHRTKSQQAGRMAWAIPLAIIPIAGIAWLGWTAYYRNETKADMVAVRLPEIKTLIGEIRAMLKAKELEHHPFLKDANLRLQFIGECYEAAANIKDHVLDETLDAQLQNVIIGLAEAQALDVKLQVLQAEANKDKGWFDGIPVPAIPSMSALNPWGKATPESQDEEVTQVEVGKTSQDLPEIRYDL